MKTTVCSKESLHAVLSAKEFLRKAQQIVSSAVASSSQTGKYTSERDNRMDDMDAICSISQNINSLAAELQEDLETKEEHFSRIANGSQQVTIYVSYSTLYYVLLLQKTEAA